MLIFADSPKALDSSVALASVMVGKCGLMRSSIVTVANELNAEEIVLHGEKKAECLHANYPGNRI